MIVLWKKSWINSYTCNCSHAFCIRVTCILVDVIATTGLVGFYDLVARLHHNFYVGYRPSTCSQTRCRQAGFRAWFCSCYPRKFVMVWRLRVLNNGVFRMSCFRYCWDFGIFFLSGCLKSWTLTLFWLMFFWVCVRLRQLFVFDCTS